VADPHATIDQRLRLLLPCVKYAVIWKVVVGWRAQAAYVLTAVDGSVLDPVGNLSDDRFVTDRDHGIELKSCQSGGRVVGQFGELPMVVVSHSATAAISPRVVGPPD
jgi:hypothetical protein